MVAMAAWWPIDPYWASDDFLALAYSKDFGNAASDLVGRQYGATDIWTFYRPLITLSFWLDQTIAGPWPPFGHCSNVVAHGVSTLLVALIWRRYLSDGLAFGAALLWSLLPGHVGSIAWAVGRVDSHTTVWCLLTVWLCLRHNERHARGEVARRWPMVLAATLALLSKELAFVVPPVCTLLCLLPTATSGANATAGFGARLRAAVRVTWPLWLLFLLYLPFRLLVLGKFGGYESGPLPPDYGMAAFCQDVLHKLQGLGTVVLDSLMPLRWIGTADQQSPLPLWTFVAAGAIPVAVAALLAGRQKRSLVLVSLCAFVILMAPMVKFWDQPSPHNLRYYYLPTVALVGLLASAGRLLVVAIALAMLWPMVSVRAAQLHADQQDRAMHEQLLLEAPLAPDGPLFVAGLPHANQSGTAVQLHFGVDRMLQPPFLQPGRQLYALRPLATGPGVFRIEQPGTAPFALPEGTTYWFDHQRLQRVASQPGLPEPQLPELPITDDQDGVLDIRSDRLADLAARYAEIRARDGDSFGLTMPSVKGPFWRVTLFTANGYLTCICSDHSQPGSSDGRIDVLRLLTKSEDPAQQYQIARILLGDVFLGDALVVPTTIDSVPEFPTLIEAGMFDLQTQRFTPSHRARRLIRFRFDRGYPAWVRTAQGH